MTPLQIKDWHTAAVSVGGEYELIYLVRGNGKNRSVADKDFRDVLEERPGVSVKSTKTIGPDVMQAVVTLGYMSAPLGAQLGHAVYAGVGTDWETRYELTNVFLRREGIDAFSWLTSGYTKLAEAADRTATQASNTFAETLEDLNLAPRHLLLYGAIGIGALILWGRR